MKKRLFPLLLALLFTLSACGGAGSGDASSASAAVGDMSMDTNGWAESADTADGGCSIPFYSDDTPVGARIH